MKRARLKVFLVVGTMVTASAVALASAVRHSALSTIVVRVQGTPLTVQVARTIHDLKHGLMDRSHLAPRTGMLFVFPFRLSACMWMKHTRLPLSVAFIDQAGHISNIARMAPETIDLHCASRPVDYALEVPQGTFTTLGAVPGDVVSGIPRPPHSASKRNALEKD